MNLFGLDKASRQPEGLLLLTTVYDNVSLAVIRGILEGADIPYLIKERGSGSSVKIIAGYSMFGTDIFVRRDQLETAAALIAPADGEVPEDGTLDQEDAGDDESEEDEDSDEIEESADVDTETGASKKEE